MSLADSSYPLLNVFWSIFIFFLWVLWIWLLVWIFIDIFRSRDLSGWAKALWFLFVLFIPLIGVLAYVIARGDKMQERTAREARQQDQECAPIRGKVRARKVQRTNWPSWPTCGIGV